MKSLCFKIFYIDVVFLFFFLQWRTWASLQVTGQSRSCFIRSVFPPKMWTNRFPPSCFWSGCVSSASVRQRGRRWVVVSVVFHLLREGMPQPFAPPADDDVIVSVILWRLLSVSPPPAPPHTLTSWWVIVIFVLHKNKNTMNKVKNIQMFFPQNCRRHEPFQNIWRCVLRFSFSEENPITIVTGFT